MLVLPLTLSGDEPVEKEELKTVIKAELAKMVLPNESLKNIFGEEKTSSFTCTFELSEPHHTPNGERISTVGDLRKHVKNHYKQPDGTWQHFQFERSDETLVKYSWYFDAPPANKIKTVMRGNSFQ